MISYIVLVTGRVQLSFYFNNIAGSGPALLRLNYQLKEECLFFKILDGDVNPSLSSYSQGRLLSSYNKVLFGKNISLEKDKASIFWLPIHRVVSRRYEAAERGSRLKWL